MSITPQQAYEAAKVLWPDLKCIEKNHGAYWATPIDSVAIDWGDTTQYPLPEPEWVDAKFPDDVGKEGRFSDDGKNWHKDKVLGRFQSGRWLASMGGWRFCQVRKVKT